MKRVPMSFRKKKEKHVKDDMLSQYPCNVHLHNALRFIQQNKPDVAYEDICHAILRSGDELSDKEKEIFLSIKEQYENNNRN